MAIPVCVSRSRPSCAVARAMPKSASTACPRLKKMFSGLNVRAHTRRGIDRRALTTGDSGQPMGSVSEVPWGTTYMWTLRKRDMLGRSACSTPEPNCPICGTRRKMANGCQLTCEGLSSLHLARGRGERLTNAP